MGYKQPVTRTVSVANGAQESDAFYTGDYLVLGVQTPAALTSAAITFLGSTTQAGTYNDVYDSDGNQVSLAVAASRAIGLSGAEADAVAAWPWLKLKCGSAEGGARSFNIPMKG